jgi:hypothetical protein
VVFGTSVDKRFRIADFVEHPGHLESLGPTFMIDGRVTSYPNIMMNNNVSVHNFTDRTYDKGCRRLFIYGNFGVGTDNAQKWGHGIQLVYNILNDDFFIRDVWASDYKIDEDNYESMNQQLHEYIRHNLKWPELEQIYTFQKTYDLIQNLKEILSMNINYKIDNLSNKLIFKVTQLLTLLYDTILRKYKIHLTEREMVKCEAVDGDDGNQQDEIKKKRKKFSYTILFKTESKLASKSIADGKLMKSISKTQEVRKKFKMNLNLQDTTSRLNNDVTPLPLKNKIGFETARIIGQNVSNSALMQTSDYIGFIDSYFHGEMTVAGKRFFLASDVTLINVNYEHLLSRILTLTKMKLFDTGSIGDGIQIVVNCLPTNLYTTRDRFNDIFYFLKRDRFQVEVKVVNKFLLINHHYGIMTKHMNNIELTPYEVHNEHSLWKHDCELKHADAGKFLSKTTMHYNSSMNSFRLLPAAKSFVGLTNLKNSTPIIENFRLSDLDTPFLHFGTNLFTNFVSVTDPSSYKNDRYVNLWTIIGDINLKTAEDPYIPHIKLPFDIYSVRNVNLKGIFNNKSIQDIQVIKTLSYILTDNDQLLVKFCTIIYPTTSGHIDWYKRGKKILIEQFVSNGNCVVEVFAYMHSNVRDRLNIQVQHQISKRNFYLSLRVFFKYDDLTGIKICSSHGQKGVLNKPEDLSCWKSKCGLHPQIMLSGISYLHRQTTFEDECERQIVKRMNVDGSIVDSVMYKIPYNIFYIGPDTIKKDFRKNAITANERTDGTRMDQFTIDNPFIGQLQSYNLQHQKQISADKINTHPDYRKFVSFVRVTNVNIN